ncbi:host specificity protein J [Chromobacterium haemolyticum]|uniref:host specificity protein J n=1 Tax=Chromobacterium haemolyticum TaxID=394935 RepID=UPI0009DB1A86|nr:phage tail protein [Chromobacterium haemolyticum]OQS41811.1 hypothetical protein B0T39_07690 [Chromobacterium haemolyticum]
MQHMPIIGAGGGGGGGETRRPVEAPDTLQSSATARVLMLVGLGEWGGLVDGEKSVFFNGVPLLNVDGTRNFERVRVESRAGTAAQAPLAGFDEIETEYSVGVEVKAGPGLVRHIDNLDASAIRVTVAVRGLFAVNSENGDTNPTSVDLAVDVRPAGAKQWREARTINISGKTRGKYQRAVRVELPESGPWDVRVRRVTGDSATQNLVNVTDWDSYTVLQSLKLSYPNYAMLGLTFDAKAFSSFPEIASEWDMAVLQVPSNYNPVTGEYAGAWDGTFKPARSSNPAWWLYTFGTDKRYNVNLPPDGAWKWDLYRIARWCDQLVSDGQGGTRRRFEMNAYHSDGADAWKALQDIASVFCGKVVPFAGGVRVMADMPGDAAAKHFMPGNVLGGEFNYSSTEEGDRHSVASVSFVDPADGWKRSVEYVEHPSGLVRYGYNPAQVVAVGCTSRAQAQQLGRYILETAQTETELIAFSAGLYACDLMPGELFTVFDPVVAGRRIGGRLVRVAGVSVELDAPVTLAEGEAYSLECPLPDGRLERRGVVVVPGEFASLKLVTPFSAQPVDGATWALIATSLQPTIWRCTARVEKEPGVYQVEGLQHNPGKWETVESGIRIEPPPDSSLPDPTHIPAVAAVSVRELSYLTGDGRRAVRLDVDWPAVAHPYLRGYVVGLRQEGGNWRELPEVSANHAEIEGIEPGAWQVRVSSVSVTGLRSVPALASVTAKGHHTPPPAPSLAAQGGAMVVNLSWRYPPGVPDLLRAELYFSETENDGKSQLLADIAYPTNSYAHTGRSIGVRCHYWLRVVDSWGNVSPFARASAETLKDPGLLLEQLKNSITSTELQASIREPLERLPDIQSGVDSLIEANLHQLLTADELHKTQGENYAFAKRELRAVSDGLKQEATDRLLLAAKVGENEAGLAEEKTVRATAVEALARDVSALKAETGENKAAILGESTVRTSQNKAMAETVSALTSTVSGQTSTIKEVSRVVDGVLAEKVVKVTAGGKIAGFGLRADEHGSAFDILADRFAISLPDGSGSRQVFVLGSVNGRPALGLAGDLLIDGSLSGNALIGKSVTADKIDGKGLELKDAAGNVIVGLGGMGAQWIKGLLTVGQIDTRGMTIKNDAGAVVVDMSGMDAAYIRNLQVDTMQIKGEAVTKADTRTISSSGWVNSFDYSFNFYCSDSGTMLVFAELPPPLNKGGLLYARDRTISGEGQSALIVLNVSAGETVRVGCRGVPQSQSFASIRYGCVLFRR